MHINKANKSTKKASTRPDTIAGFIYWKEGEGAGCRLFTPTGLHLREILD